MKYISFLIIIAVSLSTWAKPNCTSAKSDDIQIPKTNFTVGFCKFAEKKKNGVYEPYYSDLVVLKKSGATVAESETKMGITVGRIANLVFEKATDRFIAVSYDAGEFCNGIVIFDTKLAKVALQKGCDTDSDICHVIGLDEVSCKGKIECKDSGAEDEPPKRKEPITQTVSLCK